MKDSFAFIFAVVVITCVGYAAWKLERQINYKVSYQQKVQEEIKPLVVRIQDLEKRVSILEKK